REGRDPVVLAEGHVEVLHGGALALTALVLHVVPAVVARGALAGTLALGALLVVEVLAARAALAARALAAGATVLALGARRAVTRRRRAPGGGVVGAEEEREDLLHVPALEHGFGDGAVLLHLDAF